MATPGQSDKPPPRLTRGIEFTPEILEWLESEIAKNGTNLRIEALRFLRWAQELQRRGHTPESMKYYNHIIEAAKQQAIDEMKEGIIGDMLDSMREDITEEIKRELLGSLQQSEDDPAPNTDPTATDGH